MQAPALDSRFTLSPDVRCGVQGRPVMKALGRRPVALPSAAQQQAERPFWGKHWDPDVSRIEEEFYRFGQRFLVGLLSCVLGRNVQPRTLVKAGFFDPQAPVDGWGKVIDLFSSKLPPAQVMDGWQNVIDRLTASLVPPGNQQAAAEALALRSSLLSRIEGKVKASPRILPAWEVAKQDATRFQRESMEWTRARGMEYAVNLTAQARHGLLSTLVESKQAGEGPGKLERRLSEKFATLNRDWRRLALTESAMAVQNGILASVDPAEGWMAVWSAAPNACPFCHAQHHRSFRVVAPDDPRRNGETDIWVGKDNIGRSAHRYSTKLGRYRERVEMWWPCVPAHPNCACLLTLRHIRVLPPRSSKPTLKG